MFSSWRCRHRASQRRNRLAPQFRSCVERLEERLLLSNLVWTNRGQPSDKFADVFGANAEGARRVVDAVLRSWGTVLVNLNQPEVNGTPDRNTINFTISMDTARAGFGGGANTTDYAYPTVEDITQKRNGYPTAGTITLDRGTVGQPNGGWWIDPTPDEHSEYTNIISPFAARPGPAVVGTDIYSTINAEIVHVLGLFDSPSRIQNPLNNSAITRLNIPDQADGQGKGFYYVFDGPSGTHLMTSYDSGGGGTDTGSIIHTAGGTAPNFPVAFTSKFRGAVRLNGSLDAGNAAGGDTRVLASDNIALLLKDAYNYTVRLPSTIPGGTFNVALNGGQLTLRGGPDGNSGTAAATAAAHVDSSDDSAAHHGVGPNFEDTGADSSDLFTLSRDGGDLVITTELGRDGPVGGLDEDGDGNAPAFVTLIPLSDFQSLVIDTEHGDDTVVFDLSGGDFLSDDSLTYNGDEGHDHLEIRVGQNATFHEEVVFQSSADGSATLKITTVPQGSIAHMTLTSVTHVTLDGGDPAAALRSTLLIDELVSTEATSVPIEIPTQVPVSQTNFRAVTVLTAYPVPFFRAYNPGVDEHFFTTSRAEFDNAVAHGFRDETGGSHLGFTILPSRSPSAVPIYRLYNFQTGTHYLTTHAAERDFLLGIIPTTHPSYGERGWRLETTSGYLFAEQVPGSVEIFRLYNRVSGTHLLTDNPVERDSILTSFPDAWELHDHFGYAFPHGFQVGTGTAHAGESHSHAVVNEKIASVVEGSSTIQAVDETQAVSLVVGRIAIPRAESAIATQDNGDSALYQPADSASANLARNLAADELRSTWTLQLDIDKVFEDALDGLGFPSWES